MYNLAVRRYDHRKRGRSHTHVWGGLYMIRGCRACQAPLHLLLHTVAIWNHFTIAEQAMPAAGALSAQWLARRPPHRAVHVWADQDS